MLKEYVFCLVGLEKYCTRQHAAMRMESDMKTALEAYINLVLDSVW